MENLLGKRYEKKTNTETTHYVYSDKNILSETTTFGENTFTKNFINGLGIDDVNLYGYVKNNPINFTDPSGLGSKPLVVKFGEYMDASIGLHGTLIGGSIAQMDVSTYMLGKFMYGDGGSDYYGNNHWISKKLMKTDFYQNAEKKAINETIKNGKYEKSDKGDLTTPNMSNIEGLLSDFPTSFGTVDWTMTAKIVEDGKIETNFHIKDTYIFNDFYADGVTPMENPFNIMGKKYQDQGFGTPFQWELNIKQTFTY